MNCKHMPNGRIATNFHYARTLFEGISEASELFFFSPAFCKPLARADLKPRLASPPARDLQTPDTAGWGSVTGVLAMAVD